MFLSSGLWDRFRETDINAEMISGLATEVVNLTRKETDQVIYLPNNYILSNPPLQCWHKLKHPSKIY